MARYLPSSLRTMSEPSEHDESRIRARLDRERRRALDRWSSLRSRSAIIDGLAHAWEHDTKVGGGLMAGALAFRLFIFLVPWVLFAFTALGTAAVVSNSSTADMARKAGIAGVMAKGVVNTESLTTGQRWTLLAISGYAMFMAARSVVGTLVTAISMSWQVPRPKFKKNRAAVVFIVFMTVTTYLTSWLGHLRSTLPTPGVALTVAWLAVPLVAGWWLMWKLPHASAPVWALLPGAIVFAIGIQTMHLITVVYISGYAASKSETYGVIGVALAALLWCYLICRLATGCAVLSAALWRRFETNHPDLVATPPEPGSSLYVRTKYWVRASIDLFR